MQLLHDLIGDLEREREVLDERLRLAAELLNTYDPRTEPALSVVADITPTATPPAKKPKTKTKGEQVACPDCGQMFHQQGIGPHRARKHAGSAAKPVKVADRDPRDEFGDEFFACSSCNHEEPNLNGMKRHTLAMHGRPVNDTERVGIAA